MVPAIATAPATRVIVTSPRSIIISAIVRS
jgi:hypothetical protein